MASNYPGGTDSFTNPIGTQTLDTPDHAAQHGNANDAIEAMQSATGTHSGTNVLKSFVAGNFPVRMNASNVLQQNITGTFNNTIFGTPAITGGTANNSTLGTPTIVVGGDTVGDMYYRSAGGTLTRVATGTTFGILRTDGTTASFGAAVSPYTNNTITGTTASATSVDVPSGSVAIINLGRDVSIFAIASGRIFANAAANITPSLVINGTTLASYDIGVTAGQVNNGIPFALSFIKGATLGTVKLQFKTSAGTMSIEAGLHALVT